MFFNAYSSFFTRTPSCYSIEAITDIHLYRMSFDQLESLYHESKNAMLVGKRSLEYFYLQKEKREIELLCNTAEQNYRELLCQQPEPVICFPVLEVSGTHYEIGYAIGERFKAQIGRAFEAIQGLETMIDVLIAQDFQRFYQWYVDTVRAASGHPGKPDMKDTRNVHFLTIKQFML